MDNAILEAPLQQELMERSRPVFQRDSDETERMVVNPTMRI